MVISGRVIGRFGLGFSLVGLILLVLTVGIAPGPSPVFAAAKPETQSIEPLWRTVPPTPSLPRAQQAGDAPVNGVKIHYATFGQATPGHETPVILLHGGLANSEYWGHQVPRLAERHRVIVMDSRGHGRSTRDARPYGYDLMADDVIGLMDFLKIKKAAIVGWSDGGIIGLDIAIRYPDRISRLFAFGANTDPDGVILEHTPTFAAFIARSEREYKRLSATPERYPQFLAEINQMWEQQPHFTAAQLAAIRIPVLIADGDHEEAIKRSHTEAIAAAIPNAGLLIQPYVSHFSMLQDPEQFTQDVLHFLDSPGK